MTTPALLGLNNQPDKDTAVEILRGLLTNRPRNVVNYLQESAQVNAQQWRHLYRFFVNTPGGLFNVSGLVTVLFGIKLSDRSCVVSLTQMNADQDLQAFTQTLRKQLSLTDLVLEDLVGTAHETIHWTINPDLKESTPNEQQ